MSEMAKAAGEFALRPASDFVILDFS